MNDLGNTLLAIEKRLANDNGQEYERVLRDDALVIVPGAILSKRACIEAVAESTPWDAEGFLDPVLIRAADTAMIVYTFDGHRGEQHYRAAMASTYALENGEWRLLIHQQTPDSS